MGPDRARSDGFYTREACDCPVPIHEATEDAPQPDGTAQEGPTDWERAARLQHRLQAGMEKVTPARLALPLADDPRWSAWVEDVDAALERAQTRLMAVEYALRGAPIWG